MLAMEPNNIHAADCMEIVLAEQELFVMSEEIFIPNLVLTCVNPQLIAGLQTRYCRRRHRNRCRNMPMLRVKELEEESPRKDNVDKEEYWFCVRRWLCYWSSPFIEVASPRRTANLQAAICKTLQRSFIESNWGVKFATASGKTVDQNVSSRY